MEFDTFKELLKSNRSYRRFDESARISDEEMREIVGLVRYCASGRNLQPLKYRLVTEPAECAALFEWLGWAGYLSDWDGPEPGERPAAYVVQCLDLNLTTSLLCDDGLQLEALTLGALTKGYGNCIIKSFNKERVSEVLGLGENLEPRYVVALGRPVEEVVIEDMRDGDIKYWRDEHQIHHVPKRKVEEILLN